MAPQGIWDVLKKQPPTEFDIKVTDDATLTVILAGKKDAQNQTTYDNLWCDRTKAVVHVGIAYKRQENHGLYYNVGDIFEIDVYDESPNRDDRFKLFWEACLKTARGQQAVLIHCDYSFQRGPLLLTALMVRAGYTKEHALNVITRKRFIYPGHVVPYKYWPQEQKDKTKTRKFLAAQHWIAKINDQINYSVATMEPLPFNINQSTREEDHISVSTLPLNGDDYNHETDTDELIMKMGHWSWVPVPNQRATVFDIHLKNKQTLTVILSLATQDQTWLSVSTILKLRKRILNVAFTGDTLPIPHSYARVHKINVYDESFERDKTFLRFWDACVNTAHCEQAVLIRCDQAFRRGPLLLLALMIAAGYSKENALKFIRKKRIVYAGHFIPHDEWTPSEKDKEHTKTFLAAHKWIDSLSSTVKPV